MTDSRDATLAHEYHLICDPNLHVPYLNFTSRYKCSTPSTHYLWTSAITYCVSIAFSYKNQQTNKFALYHSVSEHTDTSSEFLTAFKSFINDIPDTNNIHIIMKLNSCFTRMSMMDVLRKNINDVCKNNNKPHIAKENFIKLMQKTSTFYIRNDSSYGDIESAIMISINSIKALIINMDLNKYEGVNNFIIKSNLNNHSQYLLPAFNLIKNTASNIYQTKHKPSLFSMSLHQEEIEFLLKIIAWDVVRNQPSLALLTRWCDDNNITIDTKFIKDVLDDNKMSQLTKLTTI